MESLEKVKFFDWEDNLAIIFGEGLRTAVVENGKIDWDRPSRSTLMIGAGVGRLSADEAKAQFPDSYALLFGKEQMETIHVLTESKAKELLKHLQVEERRKDAESKEYTNNLIEGFIARARWEQKTWREKAAYYFWNILIFVFILGIIAVSLN
jgi:hypothetical protein